MLGFQERIILSSGDAIFYHQTILATGENFYFLTLVEGSNIPNYFDFIANNTNFALGDIESIAKILKSGYGSLSDQEKNNVIKKHF